MPINIDRDEYGDLRLHFPSGHVETISDPDAQLLSDALSEELQGGSSPNPEYAQLRTRSGACICLTVSKPDIEFDDVEGSTVLLAGDLATLEDMVQLVTAIANQQEGDVLFGSNQPDQFGDVGNWIRVYWESVGQGDAEIAVTEYEAAAGEEWTLQISVTAFERQKLMDALLRSNATS